MALSKRSAGNAAIWCTLHQIHKAGRLGETTHQWGANNDPT